MSRFIMGLSILFISVLSCITCVNVYAQETTSTTINPITDESTTTTVNEDTQQTTVTKTNPNTLETTTTILTPVPAPQETIAAPQGYTNCFNVAAGWYKDIWVPEHSVCQYDATTQSSVHEGSAWVKGYWACTKYRTSDGVCTKWEWKSGHWVKTFQVY